MADKKQWDVSTDASSTVSYHIYANIDNARITPAQRARALAIMRRAAAGLRVQLEMMLDDKSVVFMDRQSSSQGVEEIELEWEE